MSRPKRGILKKDPVKRANAAPAALESDAVKVARLRALAAGRIRPATPAERADVTSTLAAQLLRPAFGFFDTAAPYVSRQPFPMHPADAGSWSDLEPSQVDPTGAQQPELADGPIRELLWRCRVSKASWEGTGARQRREIKEALSLVFAVQGAVRDLLDPRKDLDVREKAEEFVQWVGGLHASSSGRKEGYLLAAGRDLLQPMARVTAEAAGHVLANALEEHRRAHPRQAGQATASEPAATEAKGAAWVEATRQSVNRALAEASAIPFRAVCEVADVLRVIRGERSPQRVARDLVSQAAPVVGKDDLRRSKPRRRRERPR